MIRYVFSRAELNVLLRSLKKVECDARGDHVRERLLLLFLKAERESGRDHMPRLVVNE